MISLSNICDYYSGIEELKLFYYNVETVSFSDSRRIDFGFPSDSPSSQYSESNSIQAKHVITEYNLPSSSRPRPRTDLRTILPPVQTEFLCKYSSLQLRTFLVLESFEYQLGSMIFSQ